MQEESRSVGHDGYVEDKTFLSSLHSLKNKRTEFDRIKRLAKGGDKSAQDNLGVMYSIGDGVPQDYKEAAKWFTKAAEQGYANAQYSLGVMYRDGDGVPQDYKEAVKWYTKAAEQGDVWTLRKTLGLCTIPEECPKITRGGQVVHQGGRAGRCRRSEQPWGLCSITEKECPRIWYKHTHGTRLQMPMDRRRPRSVGTKLNSTPRQLAEAQSLSTEIYKRIEGNRQD